jgi:ABC-type uncharacterized transport system substrate-binding protein
MAGGCVNPRLWRALFSAILWWLCLIGLPADAGQPFDRSQHQLVIVTADDGEATASIVAALRKTFATARVNKATELRHSPHERPVYIAVGPAALRSLLTRRLDAPIVSVFVSSHVYQEILLETGEIAPSMVTAIYPEPSPVEHLRLIAAIYRKPVSVGVLASAKSAHLLSMLEQHAPQLGIELTIEAVESQDTINRALNRIASTSVLLALPDPTIYTPENIRNILITTYRRNQAVIGFSAAFVKAGALASDVSSIQHITAQLDELLDEFAQTGRLPQAQFPRYFDVVVNESVARSLNLVLDEAIKQHSRNPTGGAQP